MTTASSGSTVNKVAVVTGATSGIGKYTAIGLARQGMTTVLACRDQARAKSVVDEVRTMADNDAVESISLDLADLQSVRRCADEILGRFDRLDVLVNNAGGIWSPRRQTAQGLEMTFGVNHVGHVALTLLLTERLRSSSPSRVVVVSSVAHWMAFGGMRFDDLQAERHYRSFDVYARSKLANILFTRELARRLAGSGVTANAVHPGPVRSGFGMDGDLRGLTGLGNRLIRPLEITPEAGAATSIYVASAPELAAVTGGYFARCRPSRVAPWGRSDADAERLWQVTRGLLESNGLPVPDVAPS